MMFLEGSSPLSTFYRDQLESNETKQAFNAGAAKSQSPPQMLQRAIAATCSHSHLGFSQVSRAQFSMETV
jgi:hypothetical protein